MSFGIFDAPVEIRIPQPPTTNLNLNCFSKPAGFSGSKLTYEQQPHPTQLSPCKVFTVSTVSAVLQRTCQKVIATHRHNEHSKFTVVACCTNSIVCSLTLRLLMSYIYGAPILDVSRSHTTTQNSRYDSSGRVISSSQRPLPDNTRH